MVHPDQHTAASPITSMLIRNNRFFSRTLFSLTSTITLAIASPHLTTNPADQTLDQQLQQLYSSQIPKQETGVVEFLEKHPTYDGRDVVIAVFDTGVDPEAPSMQKTSTGKRKLLNIYDASGAGDVDMSKVVGANKNNTLKGLSGRTLTLPQGIENPSGEFRLGIKYGKELFHESAWKRVMTYRSTRDQLNASASEAEFLKEAAQKSNLRKELTPREKLESEAASEAFEKYLETLKTIDKGPFYDCVLWKQNNVWHVLIDTDEDGSLEDEKILRPFGIAGEWASFPDHVSMNFGVQVYDNGNTLSIVTTSGSHGTHVASIAAAHYPNQPDLDGIAPGAQILSVRIGDVRVGGSSTYMGENLAVAIAAQNKVDVMNASWGGQSIYQDASSWGNQLYNLLVQKYGVTAFVSTGNDGPALSTVGSPGGEAHTVIGVGAYVSPEMGKLLYSVVGETPASTFMFTARGPSRNGDLGVDILAPGAAITSLAKDSLYSSDLYNGTSMASPSAAGLGAILISAAKQESLHYSPARIRYALMNTATFLERETPFSQGAGLINAESAWKHLKAFQSIKALDLFYDVDVSGGTFSQGPGFYMRADRESYKGIQSTRITIQPEFPDAFSNQDRYDLNLYLKAHSDANWLQTPEFLHLSNATTSFLPEIDFASVKNKASAENAQVQFATLSLRLADTPEAGPIIEVPYTLIVSEAMAKQQILPRNECSINSSESHRRFVTAPENVNHLTLRISRKEDGDIEKLFVLHALTLAANIDMEAYETRDYFRLKPGQEATFHVETIPGKVMEINIHQVWSYDTPTELAYEGKWDSLLPSNQSVLLYGNKRPAELPVISAFDSRFELEATLKNAIFSYQPTLAEIRPFDERGVFPRGRTDSKEKLTFMLHQEFEVDIVKEAQVRFEQVQYATEFEAGGGIIEIYNEKGLLIGTDLAPSDEDESIAIPLGKNLIVRQFISHEIATLKRLKDLPLVISSEIETQPIEVSQGFENFAQNNSSTSIRLTKNRTRSLLLTTKTPDNPASPAFTQTPEYFSGSLSFQNDDDVIRRVKLYLLSKSPNDATATHTQLTPMDSVPQLEKSVYDQQISFLSQTRWSQEAEVLSARASLFKELLKNSTDPNLWLEEIYSTAIKDGLIHPWLVDEKEAIVKPAMTNNKLVLKKITDWINKAEPEIVAQYLGAQPVIDFPESDAGKREIKRKKTFQEFGKFIFNAYIVACDSHLILGNSTSARASLDEAKRWSQELPQGEALRLTKMETRLLLEEDYPALALSHIEKLLEEDPNNQLFKQWQSQAWESLGWNLHLDSARLEKELAQHPLKLR